MARIEKVELRMVDLKPKVKRTDAIQSFVSQETPIVTITDSDGVTGTGYSYTIGTGGSSVMRLLADHLAPRLIVDYTLPQTSVAIEATPDTVIDSGSGGDVTVTMTVKTNRHKHFF